MERCKEILNASLLWRIVERLCRWTQRQWENSALIHWFLHPAAWGQQACEESIPFRLWSRFRDLLGRIYAALGLDRLFAGSVFTHGWVWCAAAVVLAPILPTMGVLLLVLICFAAFALELIRHRERPLVYSGVNCWMLLYAAVYLISTLVSLNIEGTLQAGLLRVAFVLFAPVLLNALADRARLDTVISLCVLVATLLSLYGICQYFFRWGYQSDAWWDENMFEGISFRVTATLENPNMLGQFLILMIPLGGAGLFSARDRRQKIYYLLCCAVMCVCMILTMSRGAWLGLLFAGVLFFVILKPRLILLAPVALVILYFVLPETVVSRFTSIGDLTDNSTSYRVSIWMGTLAMLKDYWLCGVGPGEGAFNAVYPAYSYSAAIAQHSHNLFLQIVCDAGIVELIIFLVLLVVYVRTLCVAIARERKRTSRLYQIAFLSGVAGFLVQAMTDYSFYNYRVMLIFWAYLALGAGSARRSAMPKGRVCS